MWVVICQTKKKRLAFVQPSRIGEYPQNISSGHKTMSACDAIKLSSGTHVLHLNLLCLCYSIPGTEESLQGKRKRQSAPSVQ